MYTKKAVRLIFALLGALLICMAYILDSSDYALASEIMKDFAVIALSIVLLDLIWHALGDDFSQNDHQNSQIAKVFLNAQEAEKEHSWVELIRNSKNRIDLQGFSLQYFTSHPDIMQALKERIISGVRVRIVIMSSENPILQNAPNQQNFLYPESIILWSKQSARALEGLQNELKDIKGKKGGIGVVINKSRPISMSIRRFDDQLFVLPYIWNRNTFNSPIYFVRGESKPLFQKYIEAFGDQFGELEKAM